MQVNLDQIRSKVVPILKEAGVSRCAFFGSYVRGEARKNSDVDILVELPEGVSLFDFVDLQMKLEKALNRKVDLGEYSTIKPRLKEYILKEAVQII